MLNRLALAVLLVSAIACGSSPSTPSPAAPVYPNLVAAWVGTATLGVVSAGQTASNVCQTTWISDNLLD